MLQVKRHQPKPAASAPAPAPAPAYTPNVAAPTSSTSSSLPRTAAPLPATTHNQNRPAPKLLDAARIATNQGAPLDYCRLIVRNLAFDVDETILKQSFATALNASISKKSNGRSMGFGFVVFDNMTECKKARDALNNSVLSGRPMQIDFAQLDDKYSALKFAATLDANKKRKESDAVTAQPAEAPAESTSAKKAKVEEPKKKMSKKQAKNQVKVQNKLLATYGQKKDLGSALKMFERMKRRGLQPTVHTYSSMVNACVRCGESQRAEQFVIEMKQRGVVPNEVTYTALMKGLCNADRLQEAIALLPQCQDPNMYTVEHSNSFRFFRFLLNLFFHSVARFTHCCVAAFETPTVWRRSQCFTA
jgi:pentatricopeptide repeat protein